MSPLSAESVVLEASLGSYSLTALQKAAYRVADRCTVIFGEAVAGSVKLQFIAPAQGSDGGLSDVVQAFFREALDYALREKIAAETGPVRNLILAHAFSRTRLSDGAGE